MEKTGSSVGTLLALWMAVTSLTVAFSYGVWRYVINRPVSVEVTVVAYGTTCSEAQSDLGIAPDEYLQVNSSAGFAVAPLGDTSSGVADNGNGISVSTCSFPVSMKVKPRSGPYLVSVQGTNVFGSFTWKQIVSDKQRLVVRENYNGKVFFYGDGSNAAGTVVSISNKVYGVNCQDSYLSDIYVGDYFSVTSASGTIYGNFSSSADGTDTNGLGQSVDTCTFTGSVTVIPEASNYTLWVRGWTNTVSSSWYSINSAGDTFSVETNYDESATDFAN